ncbi:MAG: hypothetical protein EXS14_00830 [Planctomycetes bacterium]|nr:hypothetical protein [Planctomycetota bacterium]
MSAAFLILALVLAAAFGFGLMMIFRDDAAPTNPPVISTTTKPVVVAETEIDAPRIVAKAPNAADPGAPTPVGTKGVATEVAGYVRDPAGNAIKDATVQVIDYRFDQASTKRLVDRFTTDILRETVTGADGRYSFDRLTPGGRHFLRASAPSFLSQYKDHVGVGLLADFNLQPGVRVTGVVLNSKSGEPVVNAMVKGWFRTPNVSDVNRLFRWEEKLRTDEKGAFTFEGAPVESVKFIIQHDDYEDMMEDRRLTAGAVNNLEFKLVRGLLVKGVVKDKMTDAPIRNAKVSLTAIIVPRLETRTDDKGEFTMRGVERGKQLMVIGADGYTDTRLSCEFSDGDAFDAAKENIHVYRIDPAGSVAGRVLTKEGAPVDNARIFVGRKTPLTKVVRGAAEAVSDAEGRYLVRNMGAGETYALAVIKDGAAITVSPEITLGPAEMRDSFDIRLSRGGSISGSVSDELNTPVAGAVMTIEIPPLADVWFPTGMGMGGQRTETIVTGPDGHYSLENLWCGTFTFHITHPEHVELAQQKVELKDAEQILAKDFTIKVGRFVAGTVYGANGQPAEGATISAALPFTDKIAGSCTSGVDGRYRISGLIKGNYRVQARKEGFTSRGAENIPADTDGVNFTMEEMGAVIGTVLGPDGQPAVDFSTELVPLDISPENQLAMGRTASAGDAEQDAGGRFHIAGVDPGNYNLVIRAHEFARTTRAGIVVGSGAPTDVGTIMLARGARIHGKITDIRNIAVNDASISIYNATLAAASRTTLQKPKEGLQGNFDPTKLPGAEQVTWTARVDSNGEYSMNGLPPGDYTLKIESDRHVPPETETVRVSAEEDITRDYRLQTSCKGIITVMDNFNMPVPAVLASVKDAATGKRVGKAGLSPRTDAKGEVLLEGLAPGKYHVSLHRGGYMLVDTTIDLMETQTVRKSVTTQKVN